MSAFKEMMARLKKKEPGLSDDSARKIAAKIGRDTIGQKEMTRRSVAAREKK